MANNIYRQLNNKEVRTIHDLVKKNPHIDIPEVTDILENNGMLRGIANRKTRRDKVRREMEKIRNRKKKASENVVEVKMKDNEVEGSFDTVSSATPNPRDAAIKLGLDPDEYSCEYARCSQYMAIDANGEEVERTAARFSFKRKEKAAPISDEFRKEYIEYCEKLTKSGLCDRVKRKYTMAVPLPDLHIFHDANASLNKRQLKSYALTVVKYILPAMQERYKATNGNIESIDIPLLGDIVHMDTYGHTTTKGTYVGGGSGPDVAAEYAFEFLKWLIETLRKEFPDVPTRVIYVRGNHDTVHGLSVVKQLFRFYQGRGDENVLFSIDEKAFGPRMQENPQYMWVKCGNMGVTYCHGEFAKKNINNIPNIANRKARAEVEHNVVIYGHLHHRDDFRSTTGSNQHNFGLSTPCYSYDEYASGRGFLTEPEFYLFTFNHFTNRASYEAFPSLMYEGEID